MIVLTRICMQRFTMIKGTDGKDYKVEDPILRIERRTFRESGSYSPY